MGILLRGYDTSKDEREKTNRTAEATFGPGKRWSCWICDRLCDSRNPIKHIAAAHIHPVEEGSDTSGPDLVPLCEGKKACPQRSRKPSDSILIKEAKKEGRETRLASALAETKIADGDELGCHQLFDYGFISCESVLDVRKSREQNRLASPRVRQKALAIQLKYLNADFNPANARS